MIHVRRHDRMIFHFLFFYMSLGRERTHKIFYFDFTVTLSTDRRGESMGNLKLWFNFGTVRIQSESIWIYSFWFQYDLIQWTNWTNKCVFHSRLETTKWFTIIIHRHSQLYEIYARTPKSGRFEWKNCQEWIIVARLFLRNWRKKKK